MRRVLFAVAALSLFALSCNKDDEIVDKLDVPDRGQIRFINRSADPFDFYLDDTKMGNIFGNDTIIVRNIITGSHQVKAIQTANIIGTPILRQEVSIVYKDSLSTFLFP